MGVITQEELEYYQTCFGKAVQRYRKERQLTQAQLAELIGLHRSTVSKIERGKVNVALFTIIDITSVLGVSIGDLLDFEDGAMGNHN